VKTVKENIRGRRMEPRRFPHQPTNGEKIICPKGFAPTIYPMNSFPAVGSSWNNKDNGDEYNHIKD
jgi:hypothetical protein